METLKDTVELMCSTDYIDRLKAEYFQVKIRLEGLTAMLDKWEKNELPFTPKGPKAIYLEQKRSMSDYMDMLKARLDIENVEV